jgi:hypothetical protein
MSTETGQYHDRLPALLFSIDFCNLMFCIFEKIKSMPFNRYVS